LKIPKFGAKVFICLDIDFYEPDLVLELTPGHYQSYRMLPPGVHKYFFTVNGEQILAPFPCPQAILDE
jgi:hypothetical protein